MHTNLSQIYRSTWVPALDHTIEWKAVSKKQGVVKLHPALFGLLTSSSMFVSPWSLPMLVRPLPWLNTYSGGYLQHRFPAVRTDFNKEHEEYIKAADEAENLELVLKSLDVLGATAWEINSKVYSVAAQFWNKNENVPGLVALVDPPKIKRPTKKEIEQDPKVLKEYQEKVKQRELLISNAFGERCSINYKLDIARTVSLFF